MGSWYPQSKAALLAVLFLAVGFQPQLEKTHWAREAINFDTAWLVSHALLCYHEFLPENLGSSLMCCIKVVQLFKNPVGNSTWVSKCLLITTLFRVVHAFLITRKHLYSREVFDNGLSCPLEELYCVTAVNPCPISCVLELIHRFQSFGLIIRNLS